MNAFKFVSLVALSLLFCKSFSELTSFKIAIDSGLLQRFLPGDGEPLDVQLQKIIEENPEFRKVKEPFKIEFSQNKDDCNGPKSKVCIISDGTTTTVIFKNPVETSTLTMSEIKLEDKEIDFNSYVKEYAKSFSNILSEEKKTEKIEAIIQKLAADKKLVLENKKPGGNTFSADLKYSEQEDKQDIHVDFKENTLSFVTSFFENSLTLTTFKADEVEKEVGGLTKEVFRHSDRMHAFALDSKDAISNLACESVFKNLDIGYYFEDVANANSLDKNSKDKFTHKVDGQRLEIFCHGQSFKVECQPDKIGDWPILVLTVEPVKGINPFSQAFFGESLYDLSPVVNSFIEDVVVLASRTCFPD